MADFYTTTGISHHLEEIIKNAEERLWLISPYLKVNSRLKELLEDKKASVDIRVIYGKSELQPEEMKWLEELPKIKTSFRQNLHAKCYLNEAQALLTSMNLYEFSEKNNDEMGVLVSKDEDLYRKIFEEAKRLVDNSEQIRVTVARVAAPAGDRESPVPRRNVRSQAKVEKPSAAFCVRCRNELPANPLQPYCNRCFRSWKRYENKDYEEKHCHTCGKEHKATMAKPVCLDCYRKYRRVLTFQAGRDDDDDLPW